MAQLPEYLNNDFKIPTANLPGIDPRYAESVFKGQQNVANDFRSKLPGLQDTLGNQYEKSARQGLAQNLKQVKAGFNSRGLLKSGGRYGAEAQQNQATNFDVANNRYNINQGLNNTADQLDQNVANTAYGLAGVQPNIGQGLLQGTANDINNSIANNSALNDIFGGAGKGLGYIFSKLNSGSKS